MSDFYLNLPGTRDVIAPGNVIRIGRFDNTEWTVCYGWYSFAGNRPVCGWYLTNRDTVKPLQLPDLDDIYLISKR